MVLEHGGAGQDHAGKISVAPPKGEDRRKSHSSYAGTEKELVALVKSQSTGGGRCSRPPQLSLSLTKQA